MIWIKASDFKPYWTKECWFECSVLKKTVLIWLTVTSLTMLILFVAMIVSSEDPAYMLITIIAACIAIPVWGSLIFGALIVRSCTGIR